MLPPRDVRLVVPSVFAPSYHCDDWVFSCPNTIVIHVDIMETNVTVPTIAELRENVRTKRADYNRAHEAGDRRACVEMARLVDQAEKALRDRVERR
jgi:hypothetical protein